MYNTRCVLLCQLSIMIFLLSDANLLLYILPAHYIVYITN